MIKRKSIVVVAAAAVHTREICILIKTMSNHFKENLKTMAAAAAAVAAESSE